MPRIGKLTAAATRGQAALFKVCALSKVCVLYYKVCALKREVAGLKREVVELKEVAGLKREVFELKVVVGPPQLLVILSLEVRRRK